MFRNTFINHHVRPLHTLSYPCPPFTAVNFPSVTTSCTSTPTRSKQPEASKLNLQNVSSSNPINPTPSIEFDSKRIDSFITKLIFLLMEFLSAYLPKDTMIIKLTSLISKLAEGTNIDVNSLNNFL